MEEKLRKRIKEKNNGRKFKDGNSLGCKIGKKVIN